LSFPTGYKPGIFYNLVQKRGHYLGSGQVFLFETNRLW
jgi:hypothetical protein